MDYELPGDLYCEGSQHVPYYVVEYNMEINASLQVHSFHIEVIILCHQETL